MKLFWGLVDADGASSNLTTIQHQVIVLATHLGRMEHSALKDLTWCMIVSKYPNKWIKKIEEEIYAATLCGSVYNNCVSSGRGAVNGWWADSSCPGSCSLGKNRGKSTTHRKWNAEGSRTEMPWNSKSSAHCNRRLPSSGRWEQSMGVVKRVGWMDGRREFTYRIFTLYSVRGNCKTQCCMYKCIHIHKHLYTHKYTGASVDEMMCALLPVL